MNAVAKDTQTNVPPRRVIGRPFKPGNKGKPKGAKAKVTKTLRESILLAGELAGNEIRPGGGIVAYLHKVAVESPQVFVPLIGKVLPLDVTSSDGSMRPVVALYMPDNRRDSSTARVIEHEPAPAIGHDTVEDGTPAQPVPVEAIAEPVQSPLPSEPATHD